MVHSPYSPIEDFLADVTKIDAASDWSTPQSIALDINGATGVPVSVEPVPDPTQTPPYSQRTHNPTPTFTIWDNLLTGLINYHWEKLALLVLAAIIVVLAAGLVVLWRRVGTLAANKQHV